MNRKESMKQLKEKGFSYGSIGKLFKISRQRVHVIISNYIPPCQRNYGIGKERELIFKSIFERDKFSCQICGKIGILIHHIDKNDSNNTLTNLVCLCNNCHLNLHRPIKKTNTKTSPTKQPWSQ